MPPASKKNVRAALRALGEDPSGRTGKLDVKELDIEGRTPRVLRLRVGVWRVAYVQRPERIQVIRIFHRRDGYGWLERLFG